MWIWLYVSIIFCFFKQKTTYEMRISDWSSDVCSSDLHAPWLANFFTRTPGVSALSKWIGGVHPNAEMPAFARRSFRRWFQDRAAPSTGGERVLLWPDTFKIISAQTPPSPQLACWRAPATASLSPTGRYAAVDRSTPGDFSMKPKPSGRRASPR